MQLAKEAAESIQYTEGQKKIETEVESDSILKEKQLSSINEIHLEEEFVEPTMINLVEDQISNETINNFSCTVCSKCYSTKRKLYHLSSLHTRLFNGFQCLGSDLYSCKCVDTHYVQSHIQKIHSISK